MIELKEGEYYTYKWSDTYNFIFIYREGGRLSVSHTHLISTDGGYNLMGNVCSKRDMNKISPSTQAEKDHLDACIKAGKYVDTSKQTEPYIGMRVQRGSEWQWGSQGEGTNGTIIEVYDKWYPLPIRVEWDNGGINSYKFGEVGVVPLKEDCKPYKLTYYKQTNNPTHVVQYEGEGFSLKQGDIVMARELDNVFGFVDKEGRYSVYGKKDFKVLEVLGDNLQPVLNEGETSKLSNNGGSKNKSDESKSSTGSNIRGAREDFDVKSLGRRETGLTTSDRGRRKRDLKLGEIRRRGGEGLCVGQRRGSRTT